ncbi:Uncharacterised protein [Burkholderia pseudomallei]|nr:Uncharacterised protein [Burkholderia pseudomallei]CAJ4481036.1 Uncharacterised protein [Burkholderia pseudomallei]CAJ4657913.1 Uncharacterised protein [Burkholderia pseudomallei]CAJ4668883.1 Uncharacterised protein [Burkholderia pseudomallei]CAJ5802766.1 Uncharacterised protein [Burkholderia pseudomallei]
MAVKDDFFATILKPSHRRNQSSLVLFDIIDLSRSRPIRKPSLLLDKLARRRMPYPQPFTYRPQDKRLADGMNPADKYRHRLPFLVVILSNFMYSFTFKYLND